MPGGIFLVLIFWGTVIGSVWVVVAFQIAIFVRLGRLVDKG